MPIRLLDLSTGLTDSIILTLRPLEHRPENQRLTAMFKIVHGLVTVPTSPLIWADSLTSVQVQLHLGVNRNSFYPRTIPSGTTLTKKPPRLFPESLPLVHRRHSSTWCQILGVCRLRSRSRSMVATYIQNLSQVFLSIAHTKVKLGGSRRISVPHLSFQIRHL